MGGTESRRWDGMHREGARLSGLYARVCGAAEWIAAVALRALGAESRAMAVLGDGKSWAWQIWAMADLGNGMSASG